MKRFYTLLIILLGLTKCLTISGQTLNGYKYVYVPTIQYQNGGVDIWNISAKVRTFFSSKGILVINEAEKNPPPDYKNNPCLLLRCNINHTNIDGGPNKVTLKLINCLDMVVYSKTAKGTSLWSNQDDFNKATKGVLHDLANLKYSFDPTRVLQKKYPEVEQTTENESSLRAYYSGHNRNEIEGIYKTYQSETSAYYKFGIKRRGFEYIAIILEAENSNIWKEGEVKAYLEPTSLKGMYSTKWLMGDKTEYQTFALLENSAVLSIEFVNPQTNEKNLDKFIKLYPTVEQEGESTSSKKVIATGSGFAFSSDGLIATNAHVINTATEIIVKFSNEMGQKEYFAKVILTDKINDVAILKIDDISFTGFSEIPYNIQTHTNIGADVFTLGFPLNNIMGENLKISNGIINSLSGIKDDVRYLQMSVPIQPGNSGSPLFNSDGEVVGIVTAKLNEEAVGTSIENVNYAIKSSYLLNLYNMIPHKIEIPKSSRISGISLEDQIIILKNYICLIKVL